MEDTGKTKKNFSLGATDKDRRNNLIIIFLAVILVAVVVVFFMQRSENQRIIQSLNVEKQSIQTELTDMVASYDSLKTENDTINEQLFVAQTKVKDLLLEVNQIKRASYAEISRYRDEVSTLRRIMRDYIVQIDSLNRRNELLMQENIQVKQEFAQVESRNVELEREKRQLEERVTRAAMLDAMGLTATGINDRGRETNSTRRVVQIRVSLTLSKNVTTRRGDKNIYVRIQRPDQRLLIKSKNDLFRFEDLNIPFSASRVVTYEGQELPVNIFWDNTGEEALMDGDYTIDVFVDGFNIGTTVLTLRR